MSEFICYAVETAGKEWEKITFDEKLRLREIFDKRPPTSSSSGSTQFFDDFILRIYFYLFLLSPIF